jgi:uncharacterized membrane protein
MNQHESLRKKLTFTKNSVSIFLAVVVLGIFFRFAYLEHQVYWHDEAYTSLRISGYTATEVVQTLFNGKVIDLEALHQYQHPNPDKTVLDTVRSLAIEDSQHPPLYYVLVRQWATWLGPSVATLRSLSAFMSLLVFPSMYWLIQELFAGPEQSVANQPKATWIAGMAIALIAVSPFHVLYAQEVREYALWSGLILLSSAAWLRAIRLCTVLSWGIFTVLFTLALYTQPLSLLVGASYGLYLILIHRFRLYRRVLAGLGALSISLLAFIPWLTIILQNWSKTGATWTAVPLPLPILLKTWGLHLARAFVLPKDDFGFDHGLIYVSVPLILLLGVFAFYTLCRQTPMRVWLFVILLTGSVVVPLGILDLVVGGQRSTSGRYLVTFYLGLPIALAYLLAIQLLRPPVFSQRLWQAVTVIILSVSLVFCGINTQAETSWTKGINYNLPTVAHLLNAAAKPLLVSNSYGINFGTTFALSYRLNPQVKFQLVNGSFAPDFLNMPQLATGFSDIFLLNPTEPFRYQIEQQQNRKAALVFNDTHLFLWKLTD